MKISRIRFDNFHGQTKSVPVNDTFTYLNGANGRGKSTILQAMQLALLGYIPGYGKKTSDIFKHATDRQMTVEVTFDSGESIKRIFTQTSKSIDTEVVCVPEDLDIAHIVSSIELPVFNFSSLIDMTANQLKSWFINNLLSNEDSIDWDSELSDAIPQNIVDEEHVKEEVLEYIKSGSFDKIDDIPQISAYVKSLLSAKKSELTRLTSTLQTLVYYDDVESGRAIEDVKKEYTAIVDIRDKLTRAKTNQARITAIRATMDSCMDVIAETPKEFKQNLDNMIDELKEIQSVRDNIAEQYKEAKYEYNACSKRWYETDSLPNVCPISQKPCDVILDKSSMLPQIEAEMNIAKEKKNKYSSQVLEIDRGMDEMQRKIFQRKEQLEKYEKCQAELEAIEVIDDAASNLTIEECTEQENRLIDEIKHITANEIYTEMHDKTLTDKYAIEMSIEILKSYDKLTGPNGIASRLMSSEFNKLSLDIEETLSKIYGSEVTVDFDVSEKANSFSFGITRNDKYISFDMLSSGEKCLFTLALVREIVSRLNPNLKLIIIDDIFDHLDSENLDKLINYLYNEDSIQCISAGVAPCPKKYNKAVISL